MGWWFLVMLVVSVGLQYLMSPKPKKPKPAGLDEFNVPTAEVGRDIPVLFGTKEVSGPNVVWHGHFRKKAIKKSSGIFGGKTTVGYKYYLGMHMVLCHGTAKLLDVKIGDKTAWSGSTTGGQIYVDAGDKGKGKVDFAGGTYEQMPNDYLQARFDATEIPAYRGLAAAVLRRVYLGKSPYIEPWSFYMQRIPTDWLPLKAQIGDDMNPVHIIREALTNRVWGIGNPVTEVDDDNFTAIANTLYNEGFGLSLLWDRAVEGEDFISEILKYIDGGIYIDRNTGRYMLRLIRNDYDINTIPVLDESNITAVQDYKCKTDLDIYNTVTVKFWDRQTRKEHSFTAIDSTLVATMGGTNPTEVNYIGITDRDLVNKVTARELAALSAPLESAVITVKRIGAQLKYGDPFIWSWPRYGINQMVMRVTAAEYTDLTNNAVRLECTQDVFGVSESIYTAPPSSGWVNPIGDPAPVAYHNFIEAPYYWLAREGGQAAADQVGAFGHLLITGVNPGGGAYSAELWILDNAAYFEAGEADFCPTATLTSAINFGDTTLQISNQEDTDLAAAGTWAVIDAEIVRIDTIGESSIVVGRGCLDTVPQQHAAGARIYFAGSIYDSTVEQYPSGKTVYAKLLTITPYGTLAIADAPQQTLLFAARAIRPYPPARLRINGYLLQPYEIFGTISLGWKHRNRISQVTESITDTELNQSIGPESGTTYTLEVRRKDTGALLYSQTAIAGESATVLNTNINYDGLINLLLWSLRSAYESWQEHNREFFYLRTEPRCDESGEYRITEAGGGEYRILEA